VNEFAALATAQNFPLWLAQAKAYRGWISISEGDAEQGLLQLKEGVAQYKATGALFWLPFLMRLLAAGYGSAGDAVSEARVLDDALASAQRTGEVWFTPELHRMKGLLASSDPAAAERQFRYALEIARRQRSMLWQLRAATSLARLLRDQGKLNEAREVLAPDCGWFTEGFDTLDLQEAKALLVELAS
jgi:predicted ATPase